jgi:hypothetical protein
LRIVDFTFSNLKSQIENLKRSNHAGPERTGS